MAVYKNSVPFGNIVTDGLVLNLDATNINSYPGSGTTWTDTSFYRNNGTLTNGPTFLQERGRGSIVFDGVNDFISGANINLTNTSTITVSFFCKINSYAEVANGGQLIFELSANSNSSNTGVTIGYADDSNAIFGGTFPISVLLKGNAGYNISGFSKTLVNDLKWHYWTCIFDKTQTGTNPQETFLYIDGIYRTLTINPTAYRLDNSNDFGNNPYFIAARSGGIAPANAQVSNLQIYNRALSAQEVQQNFNALKSRFGL